MQTSPPRKHLYEATKLCQTRDHLIACLLLPVAEHMQIIEMATIAELPAVNLSRSPSSLSNRMKKFSSLRHKLSGKEQQNDLSSPKNVGSKQSSVSHPQSNNAPATRRPGMDSADEP